MIKPILAPNMKESSRKLQTAELQNAFGSEWKRVSVEYSRAHCSYFKS